MIYGIIYGAVGLLIAIGANAYPVLREGMGEQMRDMEAESWHIGGTLAGIGWPLLVAGYPVYWLMSKGGSALRGGIVAIGRAEKRRRERVALEEKRRKDLADQMRYVADEGPHRSR